MLVDVRGLTVPAEKVFEELLTKGAIVRDGHSLGCPGWARVSVGTRDETDFFLASASPRCCAAGRLCRREVELSMMVIMQEGATAEQVAHVVDARRGGRRQCARLHGRTRDGDRRDRRPRGPHVAADRGDGRRGPRGRHPQAVQAREPRVPAARHRHRGARRPDRRGSLRASSPARARSRRRSRCSRRRARSRRPAPR